MRMDYRLREGGIKFLMSLTWSHLASSPFLPRMGPAGERKVYMPRSAFSLPVLALHGAAA